MDPTIVTIASIGGLLVAVGLGGVSVRNRAILSRASGAGQWDRDVAVAQWHVA